MQELVGFLKSLENVTTQMIFVAIIIFQWYIIRYQLNTNKEELRLKDEKLWQTIEDISKLSKAIEQVVQEIQIVLKNTK